MEVPVNASVKFHDMVTVSLGGAGTIAHITSTLPRARGRSGRTAGSARAANTERTIMIWANRQHATVIQNRMVATECGMLMGCGGELKSSRGRDDNCSG